MTNELVLKSQGDMVDTITETLRADLDRVILYGEYKLNKVLVK